MGIVALWYVEGLHLLMNSILNIAHRGFHRHLPDNTLEAFEAAINLGVDGIEFDINETSDNEFVIFHDDKIHGVEIGKMSLSGVSRIKLLDEFKIPTLEQGIDLCRGKVKLLVELKKVHSLDRFLEVMRKMSEPREITIISFNKKLISEFSCSVPEVETAFITSLPIPDPVKLAQSVQSKGIVARFPFIDVRLVERARIANQSLFVWGCPDMKAARRMLKLDIDGIISDFPDLVRREIG
jgi:glycerophosphoryl diester phosphodiesterase